jgi:hypothetical protein
LVFEKTNLMRKSQKLFKIIRKFRPDQNGNQHRTEKVERPAVTRHAATCE